MQHSIQDINETRKTIVITVPIDKVKDEESSLLTLYQQKAKIQGFRPGKAPLAIIKKQFAKSISDELRSRVISAAYTYINEEKVTEIFSVINVNIDSDTITPEAEAILSFTVDVLPEFTPAEYKDIPVTLPSVNVEQKDVDAAVQNILNQRAEYNVVESPAKKGDYVKLSYEGSVDGTPISELISDKPMYSKQASTWEEAGSDNPIGIPAIIEALVGLKAGDKKTVSQTFNAGDHKEIPEQLIGKTAEYFFEIEEVREKVLPKLNDEFLKSIKVDSLEQLHQQIKDEFEKKRQQDQAADAREQIVKYLESSTTLHVPESAIEQETDAVLRTYMTRMLQQGVTTEQLESQKEELIQEARKVASEQAKINLILNKIASEEKIEPTNEDVQKFFLHEAYTSGSKPQDLANELKKDRARINEIRQKALSNKVLDFLYDQSKVNYVEQEEKN